MKTSVLSQSFDPTPYLLRGALTLVEFFALMRNKNPTRSAAPSVDQNPLFQAVKLAIDDGSLSALRRKADTAYLRSAISLSDAHAFVIARKDDPVWNPPGAPDRINFYRFCQKWAECRGLDWDALPRRSDAEALANRHAEKDIKTDGDAMSRWGNGKPPIQRPDETRPPSDWFDQVVAWFINEYVPVHSVSPGRDAAYFAARERFPDWPIDRDNVWRPSIWKRAPAQWRKRGAKART